MTARMDWDGKAALALPYSGHSGIGTGGRGEREGERDEVTCKADRWLMQSQCTSFPSNYRTAVRIRCCTDVLRTRCRKCAEDLSSARESSQRSRCRAKRTVGSTSHLAIASLLQSAKQVAYQSPISKSCLRRPSSHPSGSMEQTGRRSLASP